MDRPSNIISYFMIMHYIYTILCSNKVVHSQKYFFHYLHQKNSPTVNCIPEETYPPKG